MVEKVEAFEDLDVFRRAYRLSLDVHRKSLEFSVARAARLGRSAEAGLEVDLRQHCRGVQPAGAIGGGVQAVLGHGDGIGRRDAGLAALLPGPGLCRCRDLAPLAR